MSPSWNNAAVKASFFGETTRTQSLPRRHDLNSTSIGDNNTGLVLAVAGPGPPDGVPVEPVDADVDVDAAERGALLYGWVKGFLAAVGGYGSGA